MRIRDQFARWLLSTGKKEFSLKEAICLDLELNLFYKKLAIDSAVNLIAGGLSRAVFRTFEKGKEVKKNSHYLFNVQPNVNQNAAEFMRELVYKLVYENECLVIMQDENLFIADGFDVTEYALKENMYKNIVVSDYKLDKVFYESDVFYLKLNNRKVTSLIDGLYADYGKLIQSSIGYYKRSNALRATIKLDMHGPLTDKEQEEQEELFNEQAKGFFNAESGALLPLQDGEEFQEVFSGNDGRKKDSRDLRALVDDIFDFVAIAFNVPVGLLKGNVAEVEGQTDNYLMFCLSPIAELIKDEINRKYYTKKQYLEKTYLNVDISMIKYVDIAKLANALDKLLSSGSHNPNENRDLIGKESIDEDWANKYYITKNYSEIESYSEGGSEE